MNWMPFELHTHTCHTDGQFEPQELPGYAYAHGLQGVALTDHNTTACYEAFDAGLRHLPDMIGIHGMEWTTYHGHMLVLGEHGYTDWRGVGPHEMDAAVDQIHEHGGMVGIAHPYALSNPINTGYRWGFQLQDWKKIDFIEVWSRDFPIGRVRTDNAFALWNAMLQEGYHISATSGRDWHRPDIKLTHYGTTYIGIEDGTCNETGALHALKRGRSCVTAGPLLTAQVAREGLLFHPGDTLSSGDVTVKVTISSDNNVGLWQRFKIIPRYWRVMHNGTYLTEQDCRCTKEHTLMIRKGWMRIELFGTYLDMEDARIAFTNPFYIQ